MSQEAFKQARKQHDYLEINIVNDLQEIQAPTSATQVNCSLCVFPFQYEDQEFNQCLVSNGSSWCPIQLDESNVPMEGYWQNCLNETCVE